MKPRYYDETKEYIESRKAALNRDGAEGISRGQLSRQWRSKQRSTSNARSNKTVMVILAILLSVAYIIFYR